MKATEQTCSQRVAQICSRAVEHTSSLKGLFKGKGGVELSKQVIDLSITTKVTLIKLMDELLVIANNSPFNYFPIRLRVQYSGRDKTSKLRWRSHNLKLMGFKVWKDILKHPKISVSLINEFKLLEECRLLLNLEMSYLDYLIKQQTEYLANLEEVEITIKQMMELKNNSNN